MIKKNILLHCFCFLFISFVYSQSGIDSEGNTNIETIFEAHNLNIKYEAVQSLYRILDIEDSTMPNKHSFLHVSKSGLKTYFEAIRGRPTDAYKSSVVTSGRSGRSMPPEDSNRRFMHLKDSISGLNLLLVQRVSKEEMNNYVEVINCTPQEVHREYVDFIQNIKHEKR